MPALTAFSVSEKDTVYRQQNFELYPDEGETEASVTLNGLMPKGASAEAVDVTEDASRLDIKAENQKNKETDVIFAYDITIKNGKKNISLMRTSLYVLKSQIPKSAVTLRASFGI